MLIHDADVSLRLGDQLSARVDFTAKVLVARGKSDEARPLLQRLSALLKQPGLFAQRNEAEQWLDNVSLAVPGLER